MKYQSQNFFKNSNIQQNFWYPFLWKGTFFFANLQKKEKLFSKFLYEKKYTQKTKQQNKPICIGPFFRVDFLLKFFIKNRVFSSFLFEKEKRINRKFLSFY